MGSLLWIHRSVIGVHPRKTSRDDESVTFLDGLRCCVEGLDNSLSIGPRQLFCKIDFVSYTQLKLHLIVYGVRSDATIAKSC